MNKTTFIILLASIFLLGFFLGWFYASDEKLILGREAENVLVTGITDGDTIVIEGGERVRLLGINTPERGEDYYNEAKQYLSDRILMKQVDLEKGPENKDLYGRLLRYIWLNDSLINIELIEKGYASAYFYNENERYRSIIAEAEQRVIESKIGIWTNIQ